MFETFQNLPVHVLVIHGVVVGVPVAALATVAVALVPALRAKLAWLVVVLNAAMVGITYVAMESGKWFYDRLGGPEVVADHRTLGLTLIWFTVGLLAASVLLALVAKAGRVLVAIAAVLVLGAAGAAAVQTARVGHTGSQAVWETTISQTGP